LQVNAIVAFIFSILGIANCVYLINDPHAFDDVIKNMPLQNVNSLDVIVNAAIVFLILCLVLFIHIVWTYILLRKYKTYFAE